MKFKPASWNKWNWRASLARKRAKRAAASFDNFFPMCFVPESSSARRTSA
ncbi:hypothetical protein VVD49_14030 [Uliginosibacterium sp. H3]|uniref:Uncharacterized protein n=1 Tax=Uliginosibacterium silvisoli TaxID=3114758 RepID=A0ABU6K732_9RHOO|nr:hypothetical protein [Uliginosibacterium sp. H3]